MARVLGSERHEITRLREVLPATTRDADVLAYAAKHKLFVVTCNRDDFLELAMKQDNPGLIILIRRKTRQIECAHLLTLLDRAGEGGIANNINFA